jgi:hypothetical protein
MAPPCPRRDQLDQVRKIAIKATMMTTVAVPNFTSLMKPS